MKGYSRSKEDFRELLYSKYNQMEEILWCLWTGESPEDYVLCNGDSDLLPTLVKKDEIGMSITNTNTNGVMLVAQFLQQSEWHQT